MEYICVTVEIKRELQAAIYLPEISGRLFLRFDLIRKPGINER